MYSRYLGILDNEIPDVLGLQTESTGEIEISCNTGVFDVVMEAGKKFSEVIRFGHQLEKCRLAYHATICLH